jgi:hypothetical protein
MLRSNTITIEPYPDQLSGQPCHRKLIAPVAGRIALSLLFINKISLLFRGGRTNQIPLTIKPYPMKTLI